MEAKKNEEMKAMSLFLQLKAEFEASVLVCLSLRETLKIRDISIFNVLFFDGFPMR